MKKYSKIALFAGLVLMLLSLVNYSINNVWDWFSWVFIILGAFAAAFGIYGYYQFREKEISTKSVKYGTASGISIISVVGILALVAFITTRHSVRSDWTEGALYSLAEQTKSVLNDLDAEVKIIAFYKATEQVAAQDLLEEYALRSGNVNFEFVDPNTKPQIARKYNVQQYNTVVLEANGKRETINELSESALTNAIMKVTRTSDKVVYFTTGHGEKAIDSEDPQGFKKAADGIKNENYLVKTLNLAAEKRIPSDCSVLVIAGPKAEFFPFELDTIKAYLENGGDLMVLIDPQWQPGLVEFLADYNVKIGNNIIVDASGIGSLFGAGPEVPLVQQYEKHEIFEKFNVMTFYPLSCSVEAGSEGSAGYSAQSLFKSSANSWGEKDIQGGQVSRGPEDLPGPVSMAVVSTKSSGTEKSNILVVGDSDFANNSYIQNSGNTDLYLNMVNWLAEEEDKITVRPKEIDDRRLNLTAKDNKIILYSTVIGLPLLIIIAGVMVYMKRK